MKRCISLILVFVLLLSFTACGTGKEVGRPDDNEGDGAAEKGKGDVDNDKAESDEPLKISMALGGGPKTEDSWMQEELEKRLNVEFDFIMLPGGGERITKTNLLMSDPETMPDVLWWAGQQKEFKEWIAAGLVVDVLPYLKENGQNIIDYYGEEVLFYSYDDGKMYKLPADVSEPCCMTTIIRKDWLDNLGLEIPKTLDEYIDVLKAFTKDDPDQNGKDDTYGFTGAAQEWRYFSPILHPLKAEPDNYIITEDGTVKHGSVMPEMKEALKILQELYVEQVIDPTVLTTNDLDEIIANGKVGSFYRWIDYFNPSNTTMQAFKKKNPEGEYIYIDPIVGPDGFAGDEPELPGGWAFLSITSHAEDPAAVLSVLDQLLEPEINRLKRFGIEGEHYKIEDGVFESLVDSDEAAQLGIDLLMAVFDRVVDENIKNTDEVNELFEERAETCIPIRERRVIFKDFDRPAEAEYSAQLNDLKMEVFFGIISGEKDIDEFDKYVEDYYKMGGQEVEDEANHFYKIQKEERERFQNEWESISGR